MGDNPYKVLGLNKSAKEADIRRAYRKLVLKWHPDKNKSTEAEERFKSVSAAYDTLSQNAWSWQPPSRPEDDIHVDEPINRHRGPVAEVRKDKKKASPRSALGQVFSRIDGSAIFEEWLG